VSISSSTGIARPVGSGFDRGAGAAGTPGLGIGEVLGRGGETEAFATGAVDGRADAVEGRGATGAIDGGADSGGMEGFAGGTDARAEGGGTLRVPPAGMREPGGPPTCGGLTLGRTLGGGAPAAGLGLFAGSAATALGGGGASIVGMSSSSRELAGPCDFSVAQRAHTMGPRATFGRGTKVPH
jgi:hypothetical protein